MKTKLTGIPYRTTLVCVDSDQNGVLSGRLYNPYLEEGEAFPSLTRFLEEMEELLNRMQFPQSFTAARAFGPPPVPGADTPPNPEPREGKCGTFAVRVLFRQNATWQGSVTWLENGEEASFRSALELIFLIDSALCGAVHRC